MAPDAPGYVSVFSSSWPPVGLQLIHTSVGGGAAFTVMFMVLILSSGQAGACLGVFLKSLYLSGMSGVKCKPGVRDCVLHVMV